MKVIKNRTLPNNEELAIVEIANSGWIMGRMPKTLLIIQTSKDYFATITEQKSPRINRNKKIRILAKKLFDQSFCYDYDDMIKSMYRQFYKIN